MLPINPTEMLILDRNVSFRNMSLKKLGFYTAPAFKRTLICWFLFVTCLTSIHSSFASWFSPYCSFHNLSRVMSIISIDPEVDRWLKSDQAQHHIPGTIVIHSRMKKGVQSGLAIASEFHCQKSILEDRPSVSMAVAFIWCIPSQTSLSFGCLLNLLGAFGKRNHLQIRIFHSFFFALIISTPFRLLFFFFLNLTPASPLHVFISRTTVSRNDPENRKTFLLKKDRI